MAEHDAQLDEMEQDKRGQRLKYLDFVQVAAMQLTACAASLYNFAKENSGPLKPGVQTVEGTVKSVVGPVYEKLHDVPFELLKFIDRKVDESVHEVERHVPSVVKQASSQMYTAAQTVQRSGLVETAAGMAKAAYARCEPVVSGVYEQYEPVAEHYAVVAWRSANRLPLFPQVAHVLVPTAAYWSVKYNRAVGYAAERGYQVASYIPLVPVEKIAKVFGGGDADGEQTDDETVAVAAAAEIPIDGAE